MGSDAKTPRSEPRPERDRTDESLRTERENTDRAMAEQRADREEKADELVESARERADATLDAARGKADRDLESATSGAGAPEVLVEERALEDQVLEDERTSADALVEREREELARTLAALLPLEREATDRYLLTERARSDDALAHRDDFLGMVSHDLRNLLSGIVVNATLIAERAPGTDEGRDAVAATSRIQRYAARMNRLIGDLVDVASIDAGRLAVVPAPGDIGALLGEAVAAFSQTALDHGIHLEHDDAGVPLPADFDHDRMLQVLANLLGNAVKFTPRGGRILVAAERQEGVLSLSVSDTGPGIPGEDLLRVFERFWQGNAGDRRGTGLGLYISRSIVEAHGGRIWAESAAGQGSTFHVRLPAAPSITG